MVALTREQHERRLKKGRGGGDGTDYRSYLGIRDVPSMGLRTRQIDRTAKRMVVVMSNLERGANFLIRENPGFRQMKEQFPLPLDDTDAIAARLGFNPPSYKKHPVVVTTDLVGHFTGPDGDWREAVAVKPAEMLKTRRVRQLLTLEREWWLQRGVRWRLMTEAHLPKELIANLDWIDEHYDILPGTLVGVSADAVAGDLLPRLESGSMPLWAAGAATDASLGLHPGRGLTVFRHMLARRRWTVPMAEKIDTGRVLDPATLKVAAPGFLRMTA